MHVNVTLCKSYPGLPKNLGSVIVPSWRQTIYEEFQESIVVRGHIFMTSSRWGEGDQVKNGQNSDGSEWIRGQGMGWRSTEIRNQKLQL